MFSENVVITRARPLKPDELRIVEIHKVLTESWGQNSLCNGNSISKISLNGNDLISTNALRAREDADLDAEFESLLENGDTSMFPDELLQTTNMDSVVSEQRIVKGKSQKLRAMLKTIEMKEEHGQEENQDRVENTKDRVEMDPSLFNENEDVLVGDYCYTFCEEDEIEYDA